MRLKRRAAEQAHRSIRERAAQELKPQMGRMGAEDPSSAFPAAPLTRKYGRLWPFSYSGCYSGNVLEGPGPCAILRAT